MITRLGLSLNKKPTWKNFPCKRRCCDLGSQSYWLEVENFTPPHERKRAAANRTEFAWHRIHLWFVQRCLPRNFACDWEKSCESGRGGKISLDGIWNSNFYWETTGECEPAFFPNGKGKPSGKDWFLGYMLVFRGVYKLSIHLSINLLYLSIYLLIYI